MAKRKTKQESLVSEQDLIDDLEELMLEFDELVKESNMATAKLGKLAKVNESITINRYDNGWMIEVGGRDDESEWKNCKIVCNTEEEVLAVVKEYNSMDIDN
jgi:hypothetical protein